MSSIRPLSPKSVHAMSEVVYVSDAAYREIKMTEPAYSHEKIVKLATADMQSELSKLRSPALRNLNFLTATSGMFQINQLTGFGFIAQGQGGRKGELVLATRGTNFSSNKYDLATDANIGYGIGPGGHVVHRGFLKTFKGYQNDLVELINSLKLKASPPFIV